MDQRRTDMTLTHFDGLLPPPSNRHLRRSRGWNVQSVQYGPWIQTGNIDEMDEALNNFGHLGVRRDGGNMLRLACHTAEQSPDIRCGACFRCGVRASFRGGSWKDLLLLGNSRLGLARIIGLGPEPRVSSTLQRAVKCMHKDLSPSIFYLLCSAPIQQPQGRRGCSDVQLVPPMCELSSQREYGNWSCSQKLLPGTCHSFSAGLCTRWRTMKDSRH